MAEGDAVDLRALVQRLRKPFGARQLGAAYWLSEDRAGELALERRRAADELESLLARAEALSTVCEGSQAGIEELLDRAESAEAECARLRNELRVAQVTLRDRAHPGDKDTRDPPDVLATLGFWPRCGCGECYAIHCLAEARAECARLRQWLDNNTTFYDTERIEDRTVLSAVSDRIWFHATDNTKDWPFSAVIDRAIAEGKHEA